MMECLLNEGAQIKVLGDPGGKLSNLVQIVQTVKEVVTDVQAIVAPMSGTDAHGMLKARFVQDPVVFDEGFFAMISPGVPVLIGMTNDQIKALAAAAGVNMQLIATREDVGILNAIPTAEGAIQIAMEELPITIHGSTTLVMGLGKCGLTLAWRLRALGSDVYGVTRASDAIAKAQDLGIHTISYEDLPAYLPKFDIIYNSVPSLVLPVERLRYIKEDALIIDLASAPGGVDFEAAKQMGIKAMLCLGLPGKVAPRTAGQILGRVVPEMILEATK
jgi:dipicolinate synthase subunit A